MTTTPPFDRRAVTKAAREIAEVDWLGGYRLPPSSEWAKAVVLPHIGTTAPEAIEHAAEVYTAAFKVWLAHPHESPKLKRATTPKRNARWCD